MRREAGLALLMLTLGGGHAALACPTLPGDVAPGVLDTSTNPPRFRITGDGVQSVNDVVALLRAAVGLQTLVYEPGGSSTCLPVPGDVVPGLTYSGAVPVLSPVGDGIVNIADVVAMLRASVGLQSVEYRDGDGDSVLDFADGCPGVSDPGQPDADGDGITDACDVEVMAFRLSDMAPGVSDGDGVPEVGETLFLDLWTTFSDVNVSASTTTPGATIGQAEAEVISYWPGGRTRQPITLMLSPAATCNQPLVIELAFSDSETGMAAGQSTLSIPLPSTSVVTSWDFSLGAAGWVGSPPWHVTSIGGVPRWWFGEDFYCEGSGSGDASTLSSPTVAGVPPGATATAIYRRAGLDGSTTVLEASVNGGSTWLTLATLPADDGTWSVLGPVTLPAGAGSVQLRFVVSGSSWTQHHGLEISRVTIHGAGAACGVATVSALPSPSHPATSGNSDALALSGQTEMERHRLASAHDLFTEALNGNPTQGRAAVLRAASELVGPLAEGWASPTGGNIGSWWDLMDDVGVARNQRDLFSLPASGQGTFEIPSMLPSTTPDADEVQTFLGDVLQTRVRAALIDLDRVQSGTFQILIDSAIQHDAARCQPDREVDGTDALALRATLHALDGVLDILGALDLAGVDIANLANRAAPEIQRDILDPHSDLFRLRGGVADARLAAARTAFIAAHADCVQALDSLAAEADVQTDDVIVRADLFPYSWSEAELRDALGRWRAALDGPTQIDPNSSRVVSLRPFFDGDIVPRVHLPRWVTARRWDATIEVMDAATIGTADPTLAGTFPGMVRQDWLEAEGKYAGGIGAANGPPDGVARTVTTAVFADLRGMAVDGSGADLRIHVLAGSGPYNVTLEGWDAAGEWFPVTVDNRSGVATIDFGTLGIHLVDSVRIDATGSPVLLDSIEALH